MITRIKILFGLLTVGLLLLTSFACGTSAEEKPQPTTVTADNNGGAIQLKQGQELIVRLPSNPSTGYSWEQIGSADNLTEAAGSPSFEPDQPAGNQPIVGAGGTDVWTFTAAVAGQQSLRFEYKRSWETGVAPANVVTYTVTVS